MKAVIDRFEGDYAVVLFGDEEIRVDIPIKLLPEKTMEGSLLTVNFELDQSGEQTQREKIQRLINKLKNKNYEENQ